MTSLVQSGEAYAGGPLLEQSDPSLRDESPDDRDWRLAFTNLP